MGACRLCDPLALWERVQWKIVPTANPWQANYSFDPLGVHHRRWEGGNTLRLNTVTFTFVLV